MSLIDGDSAARDGPCGATGYLGVKVAVDGVVPRADGWAEEDTTSEEDEILVDEVCDVAIGGTLYSHRIQRAEEVWKVEKLDARRAVNAGELSIGDPGFGEVLQ